MTGHRTGIEPGATGGGQREHVAPLMIAVTGGIGAGKSTVSRLLAEHGAVLVDSDQLARDVVAPGTSGLDAVVARFGDAVLDSSGAMNRAAVGAIVFKDPVARKDLERIIHPLVRSAAADLATAAPSGSVVVNDIPLLVDLAQTALFHSVIAVRVRDDVRVDRLVRRGLSKSDARSRIAAQISDQERGPLADGWISNDDEPARLADAVAELWTDRIRPMQQNLAAGKPADSVMEAPDAEQFARASARLRRSAAEVRPNAISVEDGQIRFDRRRVSSEEVVTVAAKAGFFVDVHDGSAGAAERIVGYLDPAQPVRFTIRP